MPFIDEPAVAGELKEGERLLWCGAPRGGIALRQGDAVVVPVSMLWCGFAIYWEYSVFVEKAPVIFQLWGVPLVALGIYFVFGRFLVDAKRRENTWYALTSERIIISSGSVSRRVQSISLKALPAISLSEKNDLSGTIAFGSNRRLPAWLADSSWPGMGRYLPPSLEMIDNVKKVYDMIRRAQGGR